MSLVKRLPDALAQKIAAGEVVARPESVVKELLENAIDAKCTQITIILKDAGRTLIQVVDDGVGMSREDARMSFERHATSKLSQFDDLERLVTYGFRGEALAAIASVSHVEMRTRPRTDELGTVVEIDGGVFRKCESIACDEGTSISVRNLFFNVPARRKFMKSEATEFKHVIDAVIKAALAHAEIRFQFVSDGDLIFDLAPFVPLPERIEKIFGQRLRGALLPLELVDEHLHIHGFISAPSFVKRVRSEQIFFVNNRPVQSRGLSYAVASSYEHLVEKGAFPSVFLHITIDPAQVDVNVHPQKLEVKFENEREIIAEVRRALKESLQQVTSVSAAEGALAPEMTLPSDANAVDGRAHLRFPEYGAAPNDVAAPNDESASIDVAASHASAGDGAAIGNTEAGRRAGEEIADNPQGLGTLERLFGRKERDLFRGQNIDTLPKQGFPQRELGEGATDADDDGAKLLRSIPERSGIAQEVLRDRPVLWQLHNKYIFSQIKSGMMIVDQHVAHERVIFERVLKSFAANAPNSQQLLFPQHLDLLPREMALVRDLLPELERIGFHLRFFGGTSIIIDGIPADVRSGKEESILREVLESYEETGETGTPSSRDALAASFSCKAAIKSGDKLTQEEMIVLIEQLFQTDMPYVCPHGRPIVIKLGIDELDRRFGRSAVENLSKTQLSIGV